MSTRIADTSTDTRNALVAGFCSSIVLSAAAKKFVDTLQNLTAEDYRERILRHVEDLERGIVTKFSGPEGAGAIIDLEREILGLKRGYNIFSPMSSLPPEVLSKIFLIVALSQPRSVMAWTGTRRIPWIRITHVCQYWRDVALNYPSLWSDVGFLEPDCMEVILRRSQDAPLRVAAMNDRIAFTDVFGKALSQTHRLLDLDIEVSSSAVLGSLLSKLNGHAPLLQSLFIYCSRGSALLPSNVKHILHGANSLREIGFQRCGTSWSQIPFSAGLTYLQLWNSVNMSHAQCRPLKDELMQSLKSMPHLQHLDLFEFLPIAIDSSDSAYSTHPAVSLPELRQLTVYDSADELGLFFETIELLHTADIVVGFLNSADTWLGAIDTALANLQACWKGAMLQLFLDNGLQKLEVSPFSGHDDHDIEFAQVDLRFDIAKWCEASPTVSLLFEDASDLILLDDYLSNLSHTLDLSRLQALEIRHSREDPLSTFLWTASELPMLKSIAFDGSAIDGFLAGYDEDHGGGGEDPLLRAPPFPALTQIKFCEVDWNSIIVNGLAEALRSRSSHSCLGPTEIRIDACSNFGRASYAKLQDSADNVKIIWDDFDAYEAEEDYDDEEEEDEEDDDDDDDEEDEDQEDAEDDDEEDEGGEEEEDEEGKEEDAEGRQNAGLGVSR